MRNSKVTRRRVIQGAATVAAASLLPDFSSSKSLHLQAQQQAPPNPPAPINYTLALNSEPGVPFGLSGVPFMGLSYEKSVMYGAGNGTGLPRFNANNTALIKLFNLLGPGILRIGGNSVDQCLWTTSTTSKQEANQISSTDVSYLAGFLSKLTGWRCLYAINMAGNYPNPSSPTGAELYLSNREVAAVSSALGGVYDPVNNPNGLLYGIEIGNETDNYGYNGGPYSTDGWNLTLFKALWNTVRDAVLYGQGTSPATSGVTVPITGPASATAEATWTGPFGETQGTAKLLQLTQHYYRGNGKAGTPPNTDPIYGVNDLITYPAPTPPADQYELSLGDALSDLSSYTAYMGSGASYRISECNSYYGGGASGVSNVYASALWMIDFLFTCAYPASGVAGASGVNIHGGSSNDGSYIPYYTPIADDGTQIVAYSGATGSPGVRPSYYGMLLAKMAMAGQGTYGCNLYVGSVQKSTVGINATSWAVHNPSQNIWTYIVNNKDDANNLALTVTLPETTDPQKVTLRMLTQGTNYTPSLTGINNVTIQGSLVGSDGSFSDNPLTLNQYKNGSGGYDVFCYCPMLSAIVITAQY